MNKREKRKESKRLREEYANNVHVIHGTVRQDGSGFSITARSKPGKQLVLPKSVSEYLIKWFKKLERRQLKWYQDDFFHKRRLKMIVTEIDFTLAADWDQGVVAFALVSPNDTFTRPLGREIATGRLYKYVKSHKKDTNLVVVACTN